jgi:protein-tyrosine phosphatase
METLDRAAPSISSLPNLRDVGGYRTRDGRLVGTGLLYRSGALDSLAPADTDAFSALGVRTVYDLRSEFERRDHPDPDLPGVDAVVIDMMGLVAGTAPNSIEQAMTHPDSLRRAIGVDGGVSLFAGHYREFVTFPSARRSLGRLFGDLAGDGVAPALVHCMGGKDRTGWAAAALLTLLGVPAETVMADYLLTNDRLASMKRWLAEDFRTRGGPPDMVEAVISARPEYLESALDEMRRAFGDIEGYFTDGLGLDAGRMESLRGRFLAGE